MKERKKKSQQSAGAPGHLLGDLLHQTGDNFSLLGRTGRSRSLRRGGVKRTRCVHLQSVGAHLETSKLQLKALMMVAHGITQPC